MDIEYAERILDALKQRKIIFCNDNSLPVPDFENPEDFLIEPPRPKATWEVRWKCSNCGTIYNFDGQPCLPNYCERCEAIIE